MHSLSPSLHSPIWLLLTKAETWVFPGTGSLFWGPEKLAAVDTKAQRCSVVESGHSSWSLPGLDGGAGGKCSDKLQMFSRSDLHCCFHLMATMHWALESRASQCESMKPELCGRWYVFQGKPNECTWVESHVGPVNTARWTDCPKQKQK